MASIEREVENALLNVVSGIGGVNFFTSERGTARTLPSVTVQAQIGSEELVPFSGVFKTPATITYVARADATARADFDAKFYDILEQLYRDPDLASYLTDHSNITFYVAKVTERYPRRDKPEPHLVKGDDARHHGYGKEMNQSVQINIEDAIGESPCWRVRGLNICKTNRDREKAVPLTQPYRPRWEVSFSANYTGVYEVDVSVDYSDTAAKISQEDFDNTYCQIFEAFYEETPPLFTKIQNTIFDTKVYTARITSQSPTIRTAKRAWQRGLRISLICTPSELADGLRFLDFSEERNSMYVGLI
jgi:hypothetical protein